MKINVHGRNGNPKRVKFQEKVWQAIPRSGFNYSEIDMLPFMNGNPRLDVTV